MARAAQLGVLFVVLASMSFLMFSPLMEAPRQHLQDFADTGAPPAPTDSSDIVEFMRAHPQRAYFSRLLRVDGFRVGMEVGVADGRFSEHFLRDMQHSKVASWTWHMVEPFPNSALVSRFPNASEGGDVTQVPFHEHGVPWAQAGVGRNAKIVFHRTFSTDTSFLAKFSPGSLDFVYLDGAHDYKNVKQELVDFWPLVRPGGVIAGHDYCNFGQAPLGCQGCLDVPRCQTYTEYGVAHGKHVGALVADQAGVVRAVHEFLIEQHPEVKLWHTAENFTRESLDVDGMDYDLVITNTRNPSWFFLKV